MKDLVSLVCDIVPRCVEPSDKKREGKNLRQKKITEVLGQPSVKQVRWKMDLFVSLGLCLLWQIVQNPVQFYSFLTLLEINQEVVTTKFLLLSLV